MKIQHQVLIGEDFEAPSCSGHFALGS